MDSTAETVELSTVTAESAVQDTTSQEELNDTVSAHEEEEDCDIPLTQNLQSQRYLKYKPAENQDENKYDEAEDEEDSEGEGEGDDSMEGDEG